MPDYTVDASDKSFGEGLYPKKLVAGLVEFEEDLAIEAGQDKTVHVPLRASSLGLLYLKIEATSGGSDLTISVSTAARKADGTVVSTASATAIASNVDISSTPIVLDISRWFQDNGSELLCMHPDGLIFDIDNNAGSAFAGKLTVSLR